MALAHSLATLGAVAILAILFTGFGCRLLRWSKFACPSLIEELLLGAALGVIAFEAILSLVAYTGEWRLGISGILVVFLIAALLEARSLSQKALAAVRLAKFTRIEIALVAAVFLLLLLQGLAAMAPLTGSDALHYHFPTARFFLAQGFHPNFFQVHSFLTGQGHLLILAGLAMGSEKLAMG